MGPLRSSSFAASVLLCNFHLFAFGDCDAIADRGGKRIDRSFYALCEHGCISGSRV